MTFFDESANETMVIFRRTARELHRQRKFSHPNFSTLQALAEHAEIQGGHGECSLQCGPDYK
jgi:hypothetical protein